MKKTLFILVLLSVSISCKKKFICSAYNTYFIHDPSVSEEMFSPFLIDSLNQYADADYSKIDSNSKNAKYKPQIKFTVKRQNTGVLVSGKKYQNRNATEIAMKIVEIKGQSRYSLMDSAGTDYSIKNELSPQDSL